MLVYRKSKSMIKLGIYEPYKGKKYEVLGIATHSETMEKLVVYKALYGKRRLWIRPKEMFEEKIEVNGKKLPRFRYLKNEK